MAITTKKLYLNKYRELVFYSNDDVSRFLTLVKIMFSGRNDFWLIGIDDYASGEKSFIETFNQLPINCFPRSWYIEDSDYILIKDILNIKESENLGEMQGV